LGSRPGRLKGDVIRDIIERDYPHTKITRFTHRLGGVRTGHPQEVSDEEVLRKMTTNVSLLYDATAELGIQDFLSAYAQEMKSPYICVSGTFGGWGGKVVRIDPNHTEGCWMCYKLAWQDSNIPDPPSNPKGVIQPAGCGDPTFTGAGFDLVQVALTGVRLAVSTLCAGHAGGYPPADWDVMTIAFRNEAGQLIPPEFKGYKLTKHPKCPRCDSA
jgi:hypothetical protein